MKKAFLVLGIICIVVGVCGLLFSAMMWFVYKNTLDASASFYTERRSLALIGLIIGVIACLAGFACIYIYKK